MHFRFKLSLVFSLLLSSSLGAIADEASTYASAPEPTIIPSPASPAKYRLSQGATVTAYTVSPRSALTIVAATEAEHQTLIGWEPSIPDLAFSLALPPDIEVTSMAVHPETDVLYLTVNSAQGWQVVSQPLYAKAWSPTVLATSKYPLGNLVSSTRKFALVEGSSSWDSKTQFFVREGMPSTATYRLYYSVNVEGSFQTQSMREDGSDSYLWFATAKSRTLTGEPPFLKSWAQAEKRNDSGWQPGDAPDKAPAKPTAANIAKWQKSLAQRYGVSLPRSARPLAVSSDGQSMTLLNDRGCLLSESHVGTFWAENKPAWAGALAKVSSKLLAGTPCSDTGEYLPNGLGWMQWSPTKAGAVVVGDLFKAITLTPSVQYVQAPHLTPDAKALVGIVAMDGALALSFTPVAIPLSEVVNASVLVKTPALFARFVKDEGLFKSGVGPQMYSFYDEALYGNATVPHLVTTDLFWELYASVFESVFTLAEDNTGVPAFWKFVADTDAYLNTPASKEFKPELKVAFDAVQSLKSGDTKNKEARRILAEKSDTSDVTHSTYNFSDGVPRGYYTRSAEAKMYFRAMRYLTTISQDYSTLSRLPEPLKASARAWIASYQPFIAPARTATPWTGKFEAPKYSKNLSDNAGKTQLFPLSWGIDNEALDRTILHPELPEVQQVNRMVPSGLDLAAVLGSGLALQVMKPEFKSIANYKRAVTELKEYYAKSKNSPALNDTLYHSWLRALEVQLLDTHGFPGGPAGAGIWNAKRLQTGLASWATLRHSTLLVNDRGGAEAGEGGDVTFEALEVRPPRGYVEPDPGSFHAIAQLLEKTTDTFDLVSKSWGTPAQKGLKSNYRKELQLALKDVRYFEEIARKEIAGTPLSDEEYASIQFAGRAQEYRFLTFKSVLKANGAQSDGSITTPDPIAKIADVSYSRELNLYGLVGVGDPLEWQQIAPFFGRRQIVSGATYSYYELTQSSPMTDEEWRGKVGAQPYMKWVQPYALKKEPTRNMDTTDGQ